MTAAVGRVAASLVRALWCSRRAVRFLAPTCGPAGPGAACGCAS